MSSGFVAGFFARRHAIAAVAKRRDKGLPSVDQERLRTHDLANLAVLGVALGLNTLALFGPARRLFVQTMAAYMALDFAWVWTWPECVPAPQIVLPHHIATLLLLAHPLRFPAHDGLAALVCLVEFQTELLIARRYFTNELAQLPHLRMGLNVVYWPVVLLTRLLIHPWVLVESVRRLWRVPAEMTMVSGILALLCVFNVQFVNKEIRQCLQAPADEEAAGADPPASAQELVAASGDAASGE